MCEVTKWSGSSRASNVRAQQVAHLKHVDARCELSMCRRIQGAACPISRAVSDVQPHRGSLFQRIIGFLYISRLQTMFASTTLIWWSGQWTTTLAVLKVPTNRGPRLKSHVLASVLLSVVRMNNMNCAYLRGASLSCGRQLRVGAAIRRVTMFADDEAMAEVSDKVVACPNQEQLDHFAQRMFSVLRQNRERHRDYRR